MRVNCRAAITNFVRRGRDGGSGGGSDGGKGRGRRPGVVGGRKIHAYRDVTCARVQVVSKICPRRDEKEIRRARGRHVNRYCVILELFIAR